MLLIDVDLPAEVQDVEEEHKEEEDNEYQFLKFPDNLGTDLVKRKSIFE